MERTKELKKYGSTWGIASSDQKMSSDLEQSFGNKRKKKSASAQSKTMCRAKITGVYYARQT